MVVFDLHWIQPRLVAKALWSWQGGRVGKRRRKAWLYAPFCLMWSIWLERNRRMFQNVSILIFCLKSRFLAILLSWILGIVDPNVYSFLDSLADLAA